VQARSAPNVFPQAYISRVEAQAACLKAGKRLCSRGEWMLACRGTKVAPIGAAGARPCNDGKAHLLLQMFGGGYDYEEHFNSPELNQTPGFLAKTGAYAECKSESGVHDMIGNLHEWVSDTVTRSFLAQFEAEAARQYQHVQVGNGVFMGGFYSTKGELGPGCLFTTVAHDAGYHDYSTGFRCCRARRRP
jgi:formylglycine-generating enzyme required for sulfatase activity